MKNYLLPVLAIVGGAGLLWALLSTSSHPNPSTTAIESKEQVSKRTTDSTAASRLQPSSIAAASSRSSTQPSPQMRATAAEPYVPISSSAETFSSSPRQTSPEIKGTASSTQSNRPVATTSTSEGYQIDSSSSPAAIDTGLILSPGVPAPIVLSDAVNLGPLTAPQANALNQTASDLVENVQQASDQNLDQTFDAESANADSVYRNLFGESQYIQQSMSTAIEAGAGSQ